MSARAEGDTPASPRPTVRRTSGNDHSRRTFPGGRRGECNYSAKGACFSAGSPADRLGGGTGARPRLVQRGEPALPVRRHPVCDLPGRLHERGGPPASGLPRLAVRSRRNRPRHRRRPRSCLGDRPPSGTGAFDDARDRRANRSDTGLPDAVRDRAVRARRKSRPAAPRRRTRTAVGPRPSSGCRSLRRHHQPDRRGVSGSFPGRQPWQLPGRCAAASARRPARARAR